MKIILIRAALITALFQHLPMVHAQEAASSRPSWVDQRGRIPVPFTDAAAAVAQAEARMVIDSGPNPKPIQARIQSQFGGYDTGPNGEIIVQLGLEARSQLVYVAAEPGATGDLKMRRIASAAASIAKDRIEPGELWQLMQYGSDLGMGSWEAEGDHLLFVVKLPDAVSDDVLRLAIIVAGTTADEFEQAISGNIDEY